MLFSPMLAHAAKDEAAVLSDPVYVAERKYDGHRGMLELMDEAHLYSRLGHDRIGDAPFLKEVRARGLVLDGELVVPGGTSSDVADLANRDKLVYIAFDVLVSNGEKHIGQPYSVRRRMLEKVVAALAHPRLQLSEVSDRPRELMDVVKAEGGEGLMLKRLDAVYSPGKRSWAWVKLKVYRTVSVIITSADAEVTPWTVRPGQYGTDGVFYPEGKRSSTYRAGFVGLTYGFWIDGAPVKVGSLGVTGPKEEMEKHVGKVAEVKHYGQYPRTFALRHPQFLGFRDDVRPEDCVPGQE